MNIIKLFVKNTKGFTLVELLVCLSIMVIFMSGAILYNGTTKGQLSLFREEANAIAQIYKARSLAITTFSENAQDTPCGYGVHVDPSNGKIIVFKELSSGGNQDCKVFSTGNFYDSGEEVSEITLSGVSLESNFSDILFIPPDPVVYSNIDLSSGSATLTLSNGQAGSLVITINKFGQISVNQE